MAPLLGGLVEKVTLFHRPYFFSSRFFAKPELCPPSCRLIVLGFRSGSNYSILFLKMSKRKPGTFSAAKAVKANARERVGQPKPSRVVRDEPRTGRQAKHKPKLDEILRQEE